MTSRERILTTLGGGIPDRVPVVPFIQEEYLAWYYPEKNHLDRVDTVIELAAELPFDVITKHNRFMTLLFPPAAGSSASANPVDATFSPHRTSSRRIPLSRT